MEPDDRIRRTCDPLLGFAPQPAGRKEATLKRRRFALLLAVGASSLAPAGAHGQSRAAPSTLLDIPLKVTGEWGASSPRDAAAVLARMRAACLIDVALLSDRQPGSLRVENRGSGNPAIWLHDDGTAMAWIVVNVGPQDWSKLAYQFGHELGHVLANSWDARSKPASPCQWLEEALVEAFSLRGLGKLADNWERRPPFPNDAPFANALRQYRSTAIGNYEKMAPAPREAWRIDEWFLRNRAALEGKGGVQAPVEALVPTLLRELDEDIRCVADLGALNRWPERSAVAIERYLQAWKRSCHEIGTAGRLPARLQTLLGLA